MAKRKIWTTGEVEEAIALFDGGMPWKEVASKFGVSFGSLQNAVTHYRKKPKKTKKPKRQPKSAAFVVDDLPIGPLGTFIPDTVEPRRQALFLLQILIDTINRI